jgi:hypothetical protein
MKQSDINRIVAAQIVGPETIKIEFGDGYAGTICLTPQLWGPIFEPLKDVNFFRQFRLEDGTIRWPNDADFCPDVLRYWCEAGGVRSQAETDAYFTQSHAAAQSA